MIFGYQNSQAPVKLVDRLDRGLKKAGIQRHTGKDENAKASTTCLGVDFEDGRFVCPHVRKLAKVMAGTLCFLDGSHLMSPVELSALLGHLTWFALLARPVLSCFHDVYKHSQANSSDRCVLSGAATAELSLYLGLLPLLEGDLWRPWQDCIVATDASEAFGFGVSVAQAPSDLTRRIAHQCAAPSVFVRLDSHGDAADSPERVRWGNPYTVPLSRGCFTTMVSSRARFASHSGSLEASGVSLGLRWLLRSASRHSKRTLLLVDARAVLGAVAKGRSSAPTIRRELMRIAGLLLAGDLHLHLAYIPSEHNPADAPSRGIVHKWRRGRAQPWKVSRTKTSAVGSPAGSI